MDIDLVYLWCSNAEKGYSERLKKYKDQYFIESNPLKSDRRNTDHEELRYSLRSVEKFAPWIHRIFIVTDHQVPQWLNLKHPKIQIVDHSEIIPSEYLPTFNSAVIESFIHKIPGLSEYFLFANDDTFFSNKTEPNFFFTEDKKPIHYIHFMDKYSSSFWHKLVGKGKRLAEKDTHKKIVSPVEPAHNIDPYTKSLYADTVHHFWDEYKKTVGNRFRKDNDTQRFLVSCWGYLNDRLVWKKIDPAKTAYLSELSEKVIKKFCEKAPNLACFNDNDILDDNDYKYQSELFKKLYPSKSDFEITDVISNKVYDDGISAAFSKNNIPLVFVINESFLPYCAVTITSILKNISQDNNYDIIILHPNINPSLLDLLKEMEIPNNVQIRTVSIGSFLMRYTKGLFKNFPPQKVIKWVKIFLPVLLKNYSKIIYLDSDLLIKCDVSELWDINLGQNAVAGVIDVASKNVNSNKPEYMANVFHCDNTDDYINLGVMVLDLESLRKMQFISKILELLKSVPEKMWNLYDMFNAILHNHIKLLPMSYNLQYGISLKSPLYHLFEDDLYLEYQKNLKRDALIIHFTGIKPWFKIIGLESQNWWKLAKGTDFYEIILLSRPEFFKKN